MSNPAIDPEAGWIDQNVIKAVFTKLLREIDNEVPPGAIIAFHSRIIELASKARNAILEKRVPLEDLVARTQQKALKRGEPVPDSRMAHKTRMDGIKGRT